MAAMAHRLLGLTAQTPLHAGAGSATEVIDLPIQREAHSDWPCVFGSSMKGALRAAAETQSGLETERVKTLFGPDTANASEHAGSLLISDARLLLLPVRSLTGHYRWVTCPAVLRRCIRDARRTGYTFDTPDMPEVAAGTAVLTHTIGNADEALYLEEFSFTPRVDETLQAWLPVLSQLLEKERGDELGSLLTLVDDDSFRHLCRSAIPVQPHIRIENDTKTVADGALWYEENLAPDTVLYMTISAQPSRNDSDAIDPPAQLEHLLQGLFGERPWLQVGGNETVGMGWCYVQEVRDGEA